MDRKSFGGRQRSEKEATQSECNGAPKQSQSLLRLRSSDGERQRTGMLQEYRKIILQEKKNKKKSRYPGEDFLLSVRFGVSSRPFSCFLFVLDQ